MSEGPGDAFFRLTRSLRLSPKRSCQCRQTLDRMNRLGVSGCKRERDVLIQQLRESAKEYGVGDWMIAGLSAWQRGLALKVAWLDPLPDLFDIAVARAEATQ